jgi:hypothetical protein
MKIEYTLPFRRTSARMALLVGSTIDPRTLPPRISRLVALAHKLDELVRSGVVSDYAELARLGHISPARLTQIMVLLHLCPAIQEHILFLSVADARFVSELRLRKIAREPHWDRQQVMFTRLLDSDE